MALRADYFYIDYHESQSDSHNDEVMATPRKNRIMTSENDSAESHTDMPYKSTLHNIRLFLHQCTILQVKNPIARLG